MRVSNASIRSASSSASSPSSPLLTSSKTEQRPKVKPKERGSSAREWMHTRASPTTSIMLLPSRRSCLVGAFAGRPGREGWGAEEEESVRQEGIVPRGNGGGIRRAIKV